MFQLKVAISLVFVIISLMFLGNYMTGNFVFEKKCCQGPNCMLDEICTEQPLSFTPEILTFFGVFSFILFSIGLLIVHNHIE